MSSSSGVFRFLRPFKVDLVLPTFAFFYLLPNDNIPIDFTAFLILRSTSLVDRRLTTSKKVVSYIASISSLNCSNIISDNALLIELICS